MLIAIPVLLLPFQAKAQPSVITTPFRPAIVDLNFAPAPVPPDYDKSVLVPLRSAQKAAEAVRAAEAARLEQEAQLAREAAEVAQRAAQRTISGQPAQAASDGELTGAFGYASPYGNCVNEPGVNNPGWGNPIDWPVLTQTPTIGATFLFWSNHTGVVTGIWSNGDIEVRHQNFQGGLHRFPRSAFRGFR